MTIKDLLKKLIPEKGQVELPVEEESAEKVNVRIERLSGLNDVELIAKFVREGNILFLKTKELQKKDVGELQTSVQKLKRLCTQQGWDIVGTEDGYLVITPKFAKIVR